MILLSICIPTKDRFEFLIENINSILVDNVPYDKYQIVIADNSTNNDIKKYCIELSLKGVNIKHVPNPLPGFYNSIVALSAGDGALLKLHNDYSYFVPGMFEQMINIVESNIKDKPTLFFSNGTLSLDKNEHFENLDGFVNCTHFQNTWSSAFSIWRNDFNITPHGRQDVNTMFPHTSLLLNNANKNYFVVKDVFFNNKDIIGKGGYDLFDCFCNNYLGMINEKRKSGQVSSITFSKVKFLMYFKFIIPWYYKTVFSERGYTYIIENADDIIKKTYGRLPFLGIKIACFIKKHLIK